MPARGTCTEELSKGLAPDDKMGLSSLPYDLLLNIASRLDLADVHALNMTCKNLYQFSTTRPVYRQLATDLLRRCRALPLKGFQRITDLTTPQLIRSINKATQYESAWRRRGPVPISSDPSSGINSNYLDLAKDAVPDPVRTGSWYKIVTAPPGEDVDWLSPITSSYTLCATKSGKVVCWDVQADTCLAEWNPGERWELWKCRVEFEEKTVFFTMARVLVRTDDDNRVMDFVLMKLKFYDEPSGESSGSKPEFSHVARFRTRGVVMNVFLLDPSARLLSAFVWISASNTIGLYALPDWDKPEYVFIDTDIECVTSSNWSCILHERNIVIHCEESECAYQYFYPLHILQMFIKPLKSKTDNPEPSYLVKPLKVIRKRFLFPLLSDLTPSPSASDGPGEETHGPAPPIPALALAASINGPAPPPHPPPPNPNPFPFPPWCPDSAHFVRQWWPSLPGIPKVSCTVVLLAAHDQETHRTRFILAQHYFKVPLDRDEWMDGAMAQLKYRLIGPPHRLNKVEHEDSLRSRRGEGAVSSSSSSSSVSSSSSSSSSYASSTYSSSSGSDGRWSRWTDEQGEAEPSRGRIGKGKNEGRDKLPSDASRAKKDDDTLMNLWYVSTPFEVVCVMDGGEDLEDGEDAGFGERPRPLVAVDFGHAVWIEFVDNEDDATRPRTGNTDAKWLRFVTFPPFGEEVGRSGSNKEPWSRAGGQVRTLEIPSGLDLDNVETINIDQSQGAVILSVRDGRIFILCYE